MSWAVVSSGSFSTANLSAHRASPERFHFSMMAEGMQQPGSSLSWNSHRAATGAVLYMGFEMAFVVRE